MHTILKNFDHWRNKYQLQCPAIIHHQCHIHPSSILRLTSSRTLDPVADGCGGRPRGTIGASGRPWGPPGLAEYPITRPEMPAHRLVGGLVWRGGGKGAGWGQGCCFPRRCQRKWSGGFSGPRWHWAASKVCHPRVNQHFNHVNSVRPRFSRMPSAALHRVSGIGPAFGATSAGLELKTRKWDHSLSIYLFIFGSKQSPWDGFDLNGFQRLLASYSRRADFLERAPTTWDALLRQVCGKWKLGKPCLGGTNTRFASGVPHKRDKREIMGLTGAGLLWRSEDQFHGCRWITKKRRSFAWKEVRNTCILSRNLQRGIFSRMTEHT